MSQRDQPGPDVEAYLAEVSRGLDFMEEVRAEVLEELRAHLEDSAAALSDAGTPPESALRTALQRLGPPAQLAEEIKRAHRGTRRTLAAAGGGLIAAGGEGFVALMVAGASTVPVSLLVDWIGHRDWTNALSVPAESPWATFLLSVSLALVAFVAGSIAPRVFGLRAHRSFRWARFWATVAGLSVLTPLALVGVSGPQNWASAVAALLLPFWFALGVWTAPERMAPRHLLTPRYLVAVLVVVLAGSIGWLTGAKPEDSSLLTDSPQWSDSSANLSRVGPLFPADSSPVRGGGWSCCPFQAEADFVEGQPPEGFTNYRFEAWQSLPDHFGIDPDAPGPVAVADAAIEPTTNLAAPGDMQLVAPLAMNRYHDLPTGAWVVVTALRSDGTLVVLADPTFQDFTFSGSTLDWLKATDAPEYDPHATDGLWTPANSVAAGALVALLPAGAATDCTVQDTPPVPGLLTQMYCSPANAPDGSQVNYARYDSTASLDAAIKDQLAAIGRGPLPPGPCPGAGPGLSTWAGGQLICDRSGDTANESVTLTWTHERLGISASITIYPDDGSDPQSLFALPATILPAP